MLGGFLAEPGGLRVSPPLDDAAGFFMLGGVFALPAGAGAFMLGAFIGGFLVAKSSSSDESAPSSGADAGRFLTAMGGRAAADAAPVTGLGALVFGLSQPDDEEPDCMGAFSLPTRDVAGDCCGFLKNVSLDCFSADPDIGAVSTSPSRADRRAAIRGSAGGDESADDQCRRLC